MAAHTFSSVSHMTAAMIESSGKLGERKNVARPIHGSDRSTLPSNVHVEIRRRGALGQASSFDVEPAGMILELVHRFE
jgi:hypothetical protein